MNRRDFIERVAAWSAGTSLASPVFDVQSILAAEENTASETPVLAVAKGKDYAALVDKALKSLGGIETFVKKDDRVVVKPNIGWDRTPEQAANTHPIVVKTIVQRCLDAGAKRVLVFDNSVNDPRRTYVRSGIKAAVESIGDARASCPFQDKSKFVPIDIQNAKSIKRFTFYKDALPSECDCYINVPIAKDHKISMLTIGLKNVMGVIGSGRGEIHKNIHQRLADLNLVIRPKLNIVDATRILTDHGPTGGSLDDVKVLDTLIASADIVAADAYAATLFDKKPAEFGSVVAAAKMGLGQMDLSKVKIIES
jgi:uncharacterized protein (DUF362 family)